MFGLRTLNESPNLAAVPGDLAYWATENIPSDWLPCEGLELLPTERPALFKAIGYTVGKALDGIKFKIPDIIDMLRALNTTASGVDANRVALSRQVDELLGHTHDAVGTTTDGGHSHSFTLPGLVGYGGYGGTNTLPSQANVLYVKSITSTTSSGHGHGVSVAAAAGSGDNTETAPNTLVLLLCIYAGPAE